MTVNWAEFTPLMSFSGGVLIGAAALFLMLTKGRIMGVSGILTGLLPPNSSFELFWRLAFIAGIIAGPLVLTSLTLHTIEAVAVAKGGVLYLAALMVGLGTAIGSGCTSGHGICGLSRLSLRSMIAVASFVLAGVLAVFVMRHLF